MKQQTSTQIFDWQDSILKLPDQSFFALITFYLGPIQTPFNKQRLIENLTAFLKKSEVQQSIFERLSIQEIQVVSSIALLQQADTETLVKFFKDDFNSYQVKDFLLQLERRLIIFKKDSFYRVNPILEAKLSTFFSINTFLNYVKLENEAVNQYLISSIDILSFYSFCLHNPNILKSNGELRKKSLERISNIYCAFTSTPEIFNFLLRAFLNLRLFTLKDNLLIENPTVWKSFTSLSLQEMKLYLLVASTGYYTQGYLRTLVKTTEKFFSLLKSKAWYEIADVEKAFFIVKQNLDSQYLKRDMYAASNVSHETYFYENYKDKDLIAMALLFGFLVKDNNLVIVNSFEEDEFENKPISVSPSFEVTIFPTRKVKELLPIVASMVPISVHTTAVFELNRKATALFFERYGDFKALEMAFSNYSISELPQNIQISLSQWYSNFSSVKLYSGVVVVVSKEKAALFEKNMPLYDIVETKLTENIFLLRMSDIYEIKQRLESTGLESLLQVKQNPSLLDLGFEILTIDKKDSSFDESIFGHELKKEKVLSKKEFYKEHERLKKSSDAEKKTLIGKVKDLNLPKSETDFFIEEIQKNLIVHESQINTQHIKIDQIKISALDHNAKIRLCESAISQKKRLELSVQSKENVKTFLCTPIEVIRSNKKDTLKLFLSNDSNKNIKVLDISKILKLRITNESEFYTEE